jgi:UPF0755 protein
MKLKPLFKKYGWLKEWTLVIAAALIIIIGSAWGLRTWYYHSLQPVSGSQKVVYFTVETGENVSQIGKNLKRASLIKSTRAFETYVRSNNLFGYLQAGTYELSPSMSTQEIVSKLTKGEVAKNLLTILPGKRLDQIKEAFVKAGYGQTEVDTALKVSNYSSHPALASLPSGASLEGYLYPDSYQQLSNTPPETIVRQSLDQMEKYLTPEIINGFKAQGLNTYQGIVLASIILKEYSNPDDEKAIQPQIAQVLLTRMKRGMLLQADPTAFYASALAGLENSLSIDSPYNTYKYPGLPPGPISNVTANALRAAANPAGTDFLYFVAGDDGKVYFAKTLEEHQANVQKYCTTACGR